MLVQTGCLDKTKLMPREITVEQARSSDVATKASQRHTLRLPDNVV